MVLTIWWQSICSATKCKAFALTYPSLIVHLNFLFGAVSKHGFVPEGFGSGIIIPLLKDKAGNVNDINNYRTITLVPIISKLFEGVILKICENFLVTDQLQFGVKQNTGCANALFAVKTIINHVIANCSLVFVASLDLSKTLTMLTILSSIIPCYLQVLQYTLFTLYVTGTVNCLCL